MRKTLIPLMLTLAAAAPFAIAAADDSPADGPGAHMEKMLDHLLDTVDATDDQRTQIHAIEAKYRPQMTDLHQQIHDSHRGEMALDPMSSSYLDHSSTLIDQRSQLMAKAEKLHAQMKQEIAGVLNDAQRQKLRAEEANFHGHKHFFHHMDG